jgi:hypothetical protein
MQFNVVGNKVAVTQYCMKATRNGIKYYLLNPFLLYLYDVEVFFILIILQTVGIVGRVISSSQGLYINTGQKNTE